MRSLFAKTLLWFLATTAVAMIGIILTTALTFTRSEARQSPFGMLLNLAVGNMKRAYETGGAQALSAQLSRFQNVTGAKVYFTDSNGTDLLTAQPHPELRKLMQDRPRRPPWYSSPPFSRPPVLAHPDPTHNYWLIFVESRPNYGFWFLQPQHLWIIGLVALLCYGFAYHLTMPVRRLKQVVDRFGHGDLAARAGQTNRRDELGELARSFNQMAERIQLLLSAERRLLQDISHELRSPLARLGVAIELARSGEDRNGTLDRIQKEADRLNALVGELLQVTRAEADPSQQRIEPVRLDELLDDLVYDVSIEAEAKGSDVKLDAPDPITVMGDEELLRRAIENVVRNAIRYAPPNTTVEIGVKLTHGCAQVSVRDYGPGVPSESLTRIFDAFYRVDTDRNRTSGGVGLGLAIARRAIELHKGKLQARNASPGLLVTIELPFAPVAVGEAEKMPAVAAR